MMESSHEETQARSPMVESSQWYGSMQDDKEAKAIVVLSIESDRDSMAILQILPETPELPYLTIHGRIEQSASGLHFAANDPIWAWNPQKDLEIREHIDLLKAFQLTFCFGVRKDHDRPRLERNILEAYASVPTTTKTRIDAHILLRERMAPCSSEWPLEQATTWESFRDWATSKRSEGWIFRGQADPSFSLVSSLHRRNRFDIHRYLAGPLVEALLLINEKFPTLLVEIGGLTNLNAAIQEKPAKADDYRVGIFNSLTSNREETLRIARYLRHHGYPTPILDWSTDHVISAFFATEKGPKADSDDFVIYAFHYEGLKKKLGGVPGHPNLLHPANLIRLIDPKEDPLGRLSCREAPQSALYLWSGIHDLEGFIRWMEMDQESGITEDWILRRFRFSGSERKSVRDELRSNGYSRFSLFGTMDSLVEDLTERDLS